MASKDTVITQGRFQVTFTDTSVSIVDLQAKTVEGPRAATIVVYGFLEGGSKTYPEMIVWSKSTLPRELIVSRDEIRTGNLEAIQDRLAQQEQAEQQMS